MKFALLLFLILVLLAIGLSQGEEEEAPKKGKKSTGRELKCYEGKKDKGGKRTIVPLMLAACATNLLNPEKLTQLLGTVVNLFLGLIQGFLGLLGVKFDVGSVVQRKEDLGDPYCTKIVNALGEMNFGCSPEFHDSNKKELRAVRVNGDCKTYKDGDTVCQCEKDECNGSRKLISGGFGVTTLAIIILRAAI